MFKKILLSLFVLVMTVLFVGCGEAPIVNNTDSNNASSQNEAQTESVILDNEKITATYQGVTDMPNIGYFYVNLKIDNKTDKEIWVTLVSGDVDGETISMIVNGTPVYISSGNCYAAAFGFPMLNLSIDSAEEAKEATFKIVVRDKENIADKIFESDLITIELN